MKSEIYEELTGLKTTPFDKALPQSAVGSVILRLLPSRMGTGSKVRAINSIDCMGNFRPQSSSILRQFSLSENEKHVSDVMKIV